MTGYTLMELGTALLCAFLSVLHFALWRAAPKDRLQISLALSLFGMGLLNLGFAGSSGSGAGALGWPVPFLAMTGVAIIPAWLGSAMLILTLAERRIEGWRLAWVLLLGAGAVQTFVFNVQFISQHYADAGLDWELMARSQEGIFELVTPIGGMSLSFMALIEGVSAILKKRPNGFLLVMPGLPALMIVATEAWNEATGSDAPTLIGFIGLPFILVASSTVIFRYAAAMQTREYAGDYRLVRKLASGGMGELFLATRRGVGGFERPVALKRVLPSAGVDEKAVESLLNEARMAAKLVHPNIVAVQDVGRLAADDGSGAFGWFLAMEWLPGVDLLRIRDAAVQRGTLLAPEPVAAIGLAVARGLAHAHAAGIVHRDVSPHNVMVTFDGAVKIVDFGIALQPATGVAPDEGGYLFGKIAYCSPEQVRRRSEIGPPSDVYSLGVVLYELLAGMRPFRGASMMEVAEAVMKGRYVALDVVRPELPAALVAAVHKAISASPEDRFPSAEAFAAALAEWLATRPPADPGALARELCPEEVEVQRQSSAELFTPTLAARETVELLDPTRPVERSSR